MPNGLRIAETARRAGLTPVTLRYYEEIGLVPPPRRTSSGYRLYDDVALERLSFITRAKQLGCSLDEIGELLIAWDGGRCGPVQERLREVVSIKLAEAETRVVELMMLTADLRRAAATLLLHRPDGPCDDRCGCTSTTEATATTVTVSAKPPSDADPPIACTLNGESMAARLLEWRRLLSFVTARKSIDGGVRLELAAAAPVDEIARLATAEQDCCPFLSFAITVDSRGVALEARGPAEALPIMHAVFGGPT